MYKRRHDTCITSLPHVCDKLKTANQNTTDYGLLDSNILIVCIGDYIHLWSPTFLLSVLPRSRTFHHISRVVMHLVPRSPAFLYIWPWVRDSSRGVTCSYLCSPADILTTSLGRQPHNMPTMIQPTSGGVLFFTEAKMRVDMTKEPLKHYLQLM